MPHKVEPQHTPKRLSFVGVEGQPMRGIYELKEDGLRMNIGPDTAALPTKFETGYQYPKFHTNHPEFKRAKGKLAEEQLAALKQYATKAAATATSGIGVDTAQAAETPSMLLLRTVADDRPKSSGSGNRRIAEIFDRAGNKRVNCESGSTLKIGNHTVTFHGIWENSMIVESDGRRLRWTVGQDFADAVDVGPGLPSTEPSPDGGVDVADESLEGVWEVVLPPDIAAERPEDKRLCLVIAGDWQGAFQGDQLVSASRLKVEPQHTPKRLSFVDDAGRPVRGIYEVKEDGLQLNIAPDSDALPTKFSSNNPWKKRVTGQLAEELLFALKQYATKAATTKPTTPEATVSGTLSDSPEGSKTRPQPTDRKQDKDAQLDLSFNNPGTMTKTQPHESRIPVRAKLLVVKRDWSNAGDKKPQEGIRKSLSELPDTPVSRAARVQLGEAGSLGPDDLVSSLGLPSVFGAEDFANLQSWLRDQGLLLGELPVKQKAEPRAEELWTSWIDLSGVDIAGLTGKWSMLVEMRPASARPDEQGIMRVVNHPYYLARINISRTQQVMEREPGGPHLRGAALSKQPKVSFYLPKKRVLAIDWNAQLTGKAAQPNQALGIKVILVVEDAEVPEPRSTEAGFRLPERIGSLYLVDEGRWLSPPGDLGANNQATAKTAAAARHALLVSERDKLKHPPIEFRIAATKADREADGVAWFPIIEPSTPAPAGKSGANVPIEEKFDEKWRGLFPPTARLLSSASCRV